MNTTDKYGYVSQEELAAGQSDLVSWEGGKLIVRCVFCSHRRRFIVAAVLTPQFNHESTLESSCCLKKRAKGASPFMSVSQREVRVVTCVTLLCDLNVIQCCKFKVIPFMPGQQCCLSNQCTLQAYLVNPPGARRCHSVKFN